MGTNFYLHAPECPCCERELDEPLHLGKSSGGWCFGLHIHPEQGINDWGQMVAHCMVAIEDGYVIKDEYGDAVSLAEFISKVTERSWPGKKEEDDAWYAQNHAEPGPKGLARHKIDGIHCIGQGEGAYDYIIGDFS